MKQQTDSWWRTSLLMGMAAAAITALAMLFPSRWWLLPLGVGVLVFVVLLLRNPRTWSRRTFSVLLGGWLTMRAIPHVSGGVLSPYFLGFFKIEEASASNDIAVAVICLGLLVHDVVCNWLPSWFDSRSNDGRPQSGNSTAPTSAIDRSAVIAIQQSFHAESITFNLIESRAGSQVGATRTDTEGSAFSETLTATAASPDYSHLMRAKSESGTEGANSAPPAASGSECISAFARMSKPLRTRSLASSEWVPLVAEDALNALVSTSDSRVLCLLGPPGAGKTTLLARLCERIEHEGGVAVGLKVDLLPQAGSFDEMMRSHLGLNIPLEIAIATVAIERRVVVLIDQLDALAELVDLHSDRLNDVLRLVDDCSRIPNVIVVCSCREFEFNHDVRFTTVDPEVVHLTLPAWEDIVERLENAGITGAREWPESFREIIRTPQHLSVFLQQFKATGKADVSQSYQEMLDDLWERQIHTDARRMLVYDLTSFLTTQEAVWAPIASFEERHGTVDELVGAEILSREGSQLGFRHQTLLEHARARLFAKLDQSLCDHVLERQDAILIRPTIWAVLTYLRGAHPAKYRKELDALFASALRMHVRFLLLEFLGQQTAPCENEIVHFASALKRNDDRMRALFAIQGSAPWFNALKAAHLPAAMQWPAESAWPMIGVIRSEFSFARADCLEMIERYWLSDPSKDGLAVQALLELEQWDDQAVDMVCKLVRRTSPGRNWWIEAIAQKIAEDNPELATRVIGEDVRRSISDDQDAFERNERWHEVGKIAEAAPVQFMESVWNPFVQSVTQRYGQDDSSSFNRYGGWSMLLDGSRYPRPLMDGLKTAMTLAARLEPARYCDLTRPDWGSENAIVHGMIAIGLASAPSTLVSEAVDYLCGDPRRMLLGNYEDGYAHFSTRLIEAIAPHMSGSDCKRLEAAILAWSKYRPEVELSDEQRIWDREVRLQLLRAIPESRLSSDAAELAKAEEAALPNWNAERRPRVRGGFVREVPPMTVEQMKQATEDDIVAAGRGLFEASMIHSDWSDAEGGLSRAGGSHATARELAELAKSDLTRVIGVLRRWNAENNERPVAAVLNRLNDSPITAAEAFSLVCELAADREPSEEFRAHAGYLIYKRLEEKVGLPQEVCDLLESWLAMPWDSSHRDAQEEPESDSAFLTQPPQSILWHGDGGIIDADMSFWPLMAVTNGYLMREPANTVKWLEVVENHLSRNVAEATWRWYAHELRWITLRGADRKRGEAIIESLFNKYPNLATSDAGVRLIAFVCEVMSRRFLEGYLTRLWSVRSPRTAQAYGELATLLAVRDESKAWARPQLDSMLVDLAVTEGSANESLCTGVAFAAAQIWEEVPWRADAAGFLEMVAPRATKRIAGAFGSVFWASEDFVDDDNTRRLLNTIAAFPGVLTAPMVHDLVVHLAKLCKYEQELVLRITQEIVARFGSSVGNLSTELYGSGVDLVNIAMTLQRFANTRSAGLSLLEELLKLGVGEAFNLLRDIDIRPTGRSTQSMERPRRRRRRT